MSDAPAVTVLIATYNKAAALRHTIESVRRQSFTDFELWVIGDGCTDGTAEMVSAIAASDARVHWHNLPQNTGYQSAPHNEGLRRARGRWIAYLNHDDLWLPRHLELLVDAAERSGADFAYSILVWLLPEAEGAPFADIPIFPGAPLPPEASATLHRADVVRDIGFWKPPLETYSVPRADFFRRAQFAGKRFELVPRLTVLKFGRWPVPYAAAGPQEQYLARMAADPTFAEKLATELLRRSQAELQRLPGWERLRAQGTDALRRSLVRLGIDPARLVFWQKPGRHIRIWRAAHGLDREESAGSSAGSRDALDQPAEATEEQTKMSQSKATAEHMRDVLRRYAEGLTRGDCDAIMALYADDATVEDPVGSEPRRGREQIEDLYRNAAGKVRLELDGRVRVATNAAAAPMLGRPTGMPGMVVEIVDVMTFNDDGLITSMKAYWSPDTIRPE